MIDETDYIELMKNCSKWNSKIMKGRKKFVYDQQTGIVHRPSNHLYRDPSERQIPDNPMQVVAFYLKFLDTFYVNEKVDKN